MVRKILHKTLVIGKTDYTQFQIQQRQLGVIINEQRERESVDGKLLRRAIKEDSCRRQAMDLNIRGRRIPT